MTISPLLFLQQPKTWVTILFWMSFPMTRCCSHQVRGNEGCTAYSATAPAWLDQWPTITYKQVRHQSMVCYFLYELCRETLLGQGKSQWRQRLHLLAVPIMPKHLMSNLEDPVIWLEATGTIWVPQRSLVSLARHQVQRLLCHYKLENLKDANE